MQDSLDFLIEYLAASIFSLSPDALLFNPRKMRVKKALCAPLVWVWGSNFKKSRD
jgi:hypothetical protein